ncbi:MAG: 4Fe-4S cluster-binding domain-containing protein [Deltaproteobacteria bacterium]|nr:4Fe-4S cluster-binding domain-containing protein [Deltaproteobacteria bacterium]
MTLDPSWSRPRRYPIEGGAISVHSIEVHVTDHCNLRCAGCCVLSPLMKRAFLAPATLARDLSWAKPILRPSMLKLTGGEPLLSPEVVELARLAKESGIAPVVSLTTNGTLAARAPDALFELLDAMTVSVYPGVGIDEASLASLHERAARFGVRVNEKRQTDFQAMTLARRADDATVVRVFETCWLRHRCHTLRDGVLYACSRPPSMDVLEGACGATLSSDGVSLEPRPGVAEEVQALLERDRPLASCGRCAGGQGAFFQYRSLTRAEIAAGIPE